MKNFIKIAQGADVTSLALEIHQNPHLWGDHNARLRPGSPHEESGDIWVRYNDETEFVKNGSYDGFNDEHDSIWYPAFYALPSVRKLIFDLARAVEAERIGGVLIWRVPPGKEIHPHRDFGWHVDYYDKFNICIQSKPGCAFMYDTHAMQDMPGDVHRFLNTETHSVVNHSDEDYIVMCVCLRVHDYERRFKA